MVFFDQVRGVMGARAGSGGEHVLFAWDDGEDTGGGWYSADGSGWVAVGGWIEITATTADAASGSYEVTTDDGEIVAGAFEDVRYCDTAPLCG